MTIKSDSTPQTTEPWPKTGDRVLFDGDGATVLGPAMDEDLDGIPVQELCSDHDQEEPLWIIRLDSGRIKHHACQHSMVRP